MMDIATKSDHEIFVDATSLTKRMNGIKRYCLHAIESLISESKAIHIATLNPDIIPNDIVVHKHVHIHECPIKSKLFALIFFIPFVLLRHRCSIYLSINHRFSPFIPAKPQKLMVIHDLCWLHFPHTMSLSTLISEKIHFKRAVKSSNGYIFLSEATQKSFKKEFNIPERHHFVLMPNYSLDKQAVAKSEVTERYLLFVGTIEPRKNLDTVIKVFERPDFNIAGVHTLVIAGNIGWKSENTLRLIRQNSHMVLFLNPTDLELQQLYANAEAIVCPSIYEGFGLPVLEALEFSKPIICSDLESFREIAGGAAVYFDPSDPNACASAIKLALSPGKRPQLLSEAKKRRTLLDELPKNWSNVLEMIPR